LHTKYDPDIRANLQTYETKMLAFQKSADGGRDDLLQKTDSLYARKHESLLQQGKDFVTSANDSLAQFQEKTVVEIAALQKQLNPITRTLENKVMALDAFVETAKKKLDTEVKQIVETGRKERKAHNDESEKRLAFLNEESSKRMASMKDEHAKAVAELRRSAPPRRKSESSALINKLRKEQQQIANFRGVLDPLRQNVTEMLASRHKTGVDGRRKLFEIAVEMKELIDKHRDAVAALNSNVQRQTESHRRDLDELDHSRQRAERTHAEELDAASRSKTEALNQFRQQFESAQARYQSSSESSDDALVRLHEEHEKQLDRIHAEHESSIKQSELRLAHAHRDALAVQDVQILEKQKIMAQLAQLKKMQANELKAIIAEYDKEIQTTRDMFNADIAKLQKEIDNCLAGGNSESQKFKDILQELRDRKEKTLIDYAALVERHEAEHREDVENRSLGQKTELDDLQSRNETELEYQTQADEREVSELEAKLNAEFAGIEEQSQTLYTQAIAQVEQTRSERSKIESCLSAFQATLQSEQAKFDGIIAPDIANDETFVQLDGIIRILEGQVEEVRLTIELQRMENRKEWDAKFEAENERHSLHVVRSSLGTEREQRRLALLQEIGDTNQTRKDVEQTLDDDSNRLREDHLRDLTTLRSSLSGAQSTDEIDRLKCLLGDLRQNRTANSEDVNNRGTKLEDEIRKHTATEKDNQAKLLRDLDESIASDGSQSNETRARLERQITELKADFECARFKLCSDYDANQKQMTEQHRDRISGVSRDFENLRQQHGQSGEVFQRKLKGDCAQHQSSIDEYVRISEKEAEKRARDYDEMRTFYDEKLAVLTKKRDDALLIFQQRPPRQSEIDILEQLEATLQTKTIQLSNAIRDYQEFKLLLTQTEKDGHARFGKGPKIGVLTPGQRVPVH
jgi:hypothetical protein